MSDAIRVPRHAMAMLSKLSKCASAKVAVSMHLQAIRAWQGPDAWAACLEKGSAL